MSQIELTTSALCNLGFRREKRSSGTWWIYESNISLAADPSSLWETRVIEFKERRDELALCKLETSVNERALVELLKKNARTFFGNRVNAEIFIDSNKEIYCIFEGIIKDPSRVDSEHVLGESPLTTFGFKLQFAVYGSKGTIYLYDHFILGQSSREFLSKALKYVAYSVSIQPDSSTLSGIGCTFVSLQEIEFPILLPTMRQIFVSKKIPEGLDTIKSLIETKSNLVSSLTSETSGFVFEIASSKNHLMRPYTPLKKISIDVFESHEKAELLTELEILLVRGHLGEFIKKSSGYIGSHLDPYLLKRFALISLAGIDLPEIILSQITGTKKNDDKLVLCAGIKIAKKTQNFSLGLDLVSRLGMRFEKDFANFESIKSFDVILPELLGDFWSEENPNKSYISYQRIIQKRGPNARILRKMALVSQKIPSVSMEIECLRKLVKIERRHSAIAQYYLRLGRIYKAQKWFQIDGENDPLRCAISALEYQKNSLEIVTFIVEILNERSQFEAAIQIIDHILRDSNLNILMLERAKLEQLMGDIWQNGLKRPDLAQARYEHSLQKIGENTELIENLAKIYRNHSQVIKLAAMLERIFQIADTNRNTPKLKEVFNELFLIYTTKEKNILNCARLFEKLIKYPDLFADNLHNLNILLELDTLGEISRLDLYHAIDKLEKGVEIAPKKSIFRTYLGEFSRDFLHDQEKSLYHLIEALRYGMIDPNNMSFLIMSLEESKQYALLADVYERYLSHIPEGREHNRILRLMAETPKILPDDKRDIIIMKVFEKGENDFDLVEKRIEAYRSVDNLDGLSSLGKILMASLGPVSEKKKLVKIMIESLESINRPNTPIIIDQFIQYQMSLNIDRESVLQNGIRIARRFKNRDLFTKYFVNLIDLGCTPSLGEQEIVSVFKDQEEILAKYYFHISKSSAEPTIIAKYAQKTLSIIKRLRPKDELLGILLGMLGLVSQLTKDDLDSFEKYINLNQQWDLLARVLLKQAEICTDKTIRFSLLNKLADVSSERLSDLSQTRLVLEQALQLEPIPLRTLSRLSKIARFQEDLKGEARYLLSMLELSTAQPITELKAIIDRLVAIKEFDKDIIMVTLTHINSYISKNLHSEAYSLCEILIKTCQVSEAVLMCAFKAAIELKDLKNIADSWVRIIEFHGHSSAAETFRKESLRLFNTSTLKEAPLKCYENFKSKDRRDGVNPVTYYEILVHYANILFHDNIHRDISYQSYREAYQINPGDDRVWIPYLMLTNEFGDEDSSIKTLKEIIPLIEANPKAIAKYPVTIESLKLQLRKLEKLPILPTSTENIEQDRTANQVESSVQQGQFEFKSEIQSRSTTPTNANIFAIASTKEAGFDSSTPQSAPVAGFEKKTLSLVKSEPPIKKISALSDDELPIPNPEQNVARLSPLEAKLEISWDAPAPRATFTSNAVDLGKDREISFELTEKPAASELEHKSELQPDMPPIPTLLIPPAPLPAELLPAAPLQKFLKTPHSPDLPIFSLEPQPPVNPDLAPEAPSATPIEQESTETLTPGTRPPATKLKDFNWREIVLSGFADRNQVERALQADFSSELEKHLAVQSLALLSGELELLMTRWERRVWRYPSEYFYPLSIRNRIPGYYTGYKSPMLLPLQSLLFQLVQLVSPVLIKIYHERFSVEYLTKVAKIRSDRIAKSTQPLDWNSGLLFDVGLYHYAQRFKSREIVCVNLRGLNQIIFFDGREKKIYIDALFYKEMPSSALFHRMVGLLWEIRLNYYVPLALDPKVSILPMFSYIAKRSQEHSATKVGRILKTDKNALSSAIGRLDQRLLNDLIEKIGPIQDTQLYALWRSMRLYTQCMMICETLDIIGTFESISGRDLIQKKLQPGEAKKMFTDSPFLFDLVTQLSV